MEETRLENDKQLSQKQGWLNRVKLVRYLMGVVSLLLVMSLGLAACSSSSNNSNSGNGSSSGSNDSGNSTSNSNGNSNVDLSSSSAGSNTNSNNQAQPVSLQANGGLLNPTGNLEVDIQNVVAKVQQSVVLITVRTAQGEAAGTGSIITTDGYIMTNYHVIDGAQQITVVLFNGQKITGQLVKSFAYNDLAVIKVNGSNLPALPMGSSSALKVGQWVVAIGNALALKGSPTVTAGIVGALGRSIQEPAPTNANLTNLIQTDAAINPGNSGGPLVNLSGEIVGINTAAPVDPESQSAAQGIGFAISIDQARPIVQSAVSGQPVQRPFLGIQPQDMSAGLAARYNLATDTGVLIVKVTSGSPADRAGWKAGDVLVGMDNTQITSLNDLSAVLGRHKAGDTVQAVLVGQNGQQRQSTITFGQSSN